MSDELFNELGYEPGKDYVPGQWEKIAIHDEFNVRGFFGPYRFLSNFEPAQCIFEGVQYPSSENAYQAAKVAPPYRKDFLTCSAQASKRLWKKKEFVQLYTEESWDAIKYAVMRECVMSKFTLNRDLRRKLIETGDRYLEETNWWKDIYWGYVPYMKAGRNELGRLLMKTRDYWK